jgi:hypothetical protein
MITNGICAIFLMILAAVLWRKSSRVASGADRTWVAMYRNPQIPWYFGRGFLVYRYLWIAAFVGGIGFLLLVPGYIGLNLVGDVCLTLGILLCVYAIVLEHQAPDRLKPQWLREEEYGAVAANGASRIAKLLDDSVLLIPLGFGLVALITGLILLIRTLF